MKTLETERLKLRKWQKIDASDMFEFCKSSNVERVDCRIHENIDESLECIRLYIKSQDVWAIILKENSKPLGWHRFYDINRHYQYKKVEFVLSEDYQNKGYATEAVKRVLEYALGKHDLIIVKIYYYQYNIKSKSFIEKYNFTYDGTLHKTAKIYLTVCDIL